jgi:hypothetical protein
MKVEFHEKKSKNLTQPYIETRFYADGIMEFLKWCDDENKVQDWSWDWIAKQIAKMKTWKRPTPKFDHSFNGKTIYIYPKQNVVAVVECRLHYVCQHSFDILPRKIRENIYSEANFQIGMLVTMKEQRLPVMSRDIIDGFLLHSEQEKSHGSSFVRWIQHRRNKEKQKRS